MDHEDQHFPEQSDISPAIPLEISADLAAMVDEILQDFAEGAELETALVVERSGALVSGISSEAEVMVEIISALVAGASAAMNALVKELGSTGNIESFHQSEERAVYLAEIMDRFVLVGVSTVPVPVGVIREKARRIRPALIDLLQEVNVVPATEVVDEKKTFSLREMALTRAAEGSSGVDSGSEVMATDEDLPTASAELLEETEETNIFDDGEDDEESGPVAQEAAPGELVLDEDEVDTVFEAVEEDEPETGPVDVDDEPGEPTEVIEYLGDDTPEIVIEDSTGDVIDSPFEAEEEDEIEGEDIPTESIFELEEEEPDDDSIELQIPAGDEGSENEPPVFEIEPEEAEEEESVFEADEPETETSRPVFELDEESTGEDSNDETFELDFDDFEEDGESERKSVDGSSGEVESGEKEEEEASNSGPFYF